MEKITLTIDAQTFNVLMAGLEELPHKISRKIIDDLVNQVKPQINDTPQGPLSDKVFN